MSVITAQELTIGRGDGAALLVQWLNVTEADTCMPIEVPEYPNKSVQVVGTFGGATAIVSGSNDAVNFVPLVQSLGGVAVSLAAAGLQPVYDYVRQFRPSASGGVAQSLNI